MAPRSAALDTILIHIVLAIVGTALVWKGSGILESAAEGLAVYYRLPDVVTGAVIVAVGSSFPELSTTVISTLVHDQFELGMSAIIGSAIFNILVIPAIAGLATGERFVTSRDVVYKEGLFYMLAVAIMVVTFAIAVIYNPSPGSHGSLLGSLDRWLALIPLGAYALYVFVQWQDTADGRSERTREEIAVGRQWLRLGLSLVLVALGVEGLVRSAIAFGDILSTPSQLWGITVIAAATSLPDTLASVRASRHHRHETSLANVLGSNVFDLLVAIPVGVMLGGAVIIDFTLAVPLMAALTVATLMLFVFMRTGMRISKRESVVMLFAYAAFVVWIALESFGVIDTIIGLPPSG